MIASPKQERSQIRTIEQLLRRYDLEAIASIQRATENNTLGLNKTNATLEQFVVATMGSLENMQSQIDGNISTWFYKGMPTLENTPANEWASTTDKDAHLGDLYYDQDTGYGYRFSVTDGTYEWIKLTDNDVVEALAIANAAQDTADGKRRVFTDTPSPPYDVGDLWFKSKEIYICNVAKPEGGKYESDDFGIATKYTDDTKANEVADDLAKNYSTTVEMNSAISKSANEILVSVAATYTTKNELTNEIKALEEQYTAVSLKADGLETTVTSHTTQIGNLSTRVTSAESSITQHAKEIDLRVKSDSVIAAINLSPETALISAKHIDLVGAVTFSALDSSTQSKINTASTNASNAVTTANTANTNASNAVTTANTANTNASTALSTANTANDTATDALSTANTASANASSALSTATTASTNATSALNRATYHYGTCSTAAATVAKVVTLRGFSLYTGAMVSVYFTYANTASSPTLNVNGTGAKSIRVNNAAITAPYYWQAGNTVTFIYNGTYWVMADTSANNILANWCYNNDKTYIDGGKIYAKSVTAAQIDVENLFAQDITATGSITGMTIISTDGTAAGTVKIEDGILIVGNPNGARITMANGGMGLSNGGTGGGAIRLAGNGIEHYVPAGSPFFIADGANYPFTINKSDTYKGIIDITYPLMTADIYSGDIEALSIVCTDVRIRNGISLSELNSKLSNTDIYQTDTFNNWYPNLGGLSIGWGLPTENGGYEGCFHIQMGWVAIQFKATAGDTIFVRMRYGDNGWSAWKQIY